MSRVIGIDLGTTYSAVAYLNNGKPEVIPDKSVGKELSSKVIPSKVLPSKVLPSVVTFLENSILVGEPAKRAEFTSPDTTIKRIKRKMGTDYKFSYKGKDYTPEEISSFILKELKIRAEEFLKEKITDAIITVPAYFNDNQRQATKNAGRLAGLNVIRIINEPTAASLAYGIKPEEDLNILVYDLGGGTFDVSVLNVAEGVFEVTATAGDNNLGGEDFNKRIMECVLENFRKETNIDLSEDMLAMAKLSEAIERAKIELSSAESTKIFVPFITADEKGPKNIDFELKRKEFENLISDYVDRTLELCRQAVSDASLKIEQIDRVILVGGSSRIPIVRRKLEDLFKKKLDASIDPEEVVACGAAIQGGIVQGDINGIVLVDVTPLSLGVEVENGFFVPIIERNSPIPTSAKRIFTTIADNQKSVDIHILQGESMYVKNNISLGRFRLEGVRNARKGEPRIEVNFELDVNGILQVSAVDLDTKNMQGITIVNQNRMSEEELLRIQKEYISKFEREIKKRDILNNILIQKTRAESMITKLDSILPPLHQKYLIKDEIKEIYQHINESIKELNPEKMEKAISRLDFLLSELTAGSYSSVEVN